MERIENKGKSFINKLFSNKNKPDIKPQFGNLPSWEFIVDHVGNYLNISTEVHDCLGIPVSNFLDQSIFSFGINPASGERLYELFSKQTFPIEVEVIFVSIDNDLIFCNLKLTKFSEEYHSNPTYIGIAQILEELPKPKILDAQENLATSNILEKTPYLNVSQSSKMDEIFDGSGNNGAHSKNQPVTNRSIREENQTKVHEILNRYTQDVNHLIEPIDIYRLTHTVINDIVPNNNLLIGIINKDNNKISIPIRKCQNEISYFPEHDPLEPILHSIIESNRKTISNHQIDSFFQNNYHLFDEGIPKSYVGIPIAMGNQKLGAIFLFENYEHQKFTDLEVENLFTVSQKMASALVNANLFHEMQYALTAIETREQYQSFVTHAIKILSQFGSSRLDQVLELLGKAANVNRVYFAQINTEYESEKWNVVSEWSSEESYKGFHLSKEIPFDIFNEFFPQLLDNGYFQVNYENLDRRVEEWLRIRQVFSILVIAVRSGHKIPELIIFEDLQKPHFWNHDDIKFLELVSETLSSTIINEKKIYHLHHQISEAEKISTIKNILYKSTTFEQILDGIIQYIFPEDFSQAALYYFGKSDSPHFDHYDVIANCSTNLDELQKLQTHYFDRSTVKSLFQGEIPNYIENPLVENLPKKALQQLSNLNIQSYAVLPLKTKGKLFGSIILTSNNPHKFTQDEQNLVNSLLELITITIENHMMMDRSKAVKNENEFFKKIKSIVKNQDPIQLVTFLSEFLKLDNNRLISIFIFEKSTGSTFLNQISLIHEFSINELPSLNEYWQSQDFLNFINKMINQGIESFDDLLHLKGEPELTKKLQNLRIRSGYFLPLQDQEDEIGFLTIFSDQPFIINKYNSEILKFTTEEISNFLSNQIKTRLLSFLKERINIAAGIVQETSSILDIDQLMKVIVQEIQEKFGFSYTSLHICCSDTSLIEKVEVSQNGIEHSDQTHNEGYENSYLIVSDVLEKGKAVIFNDQPVLADNSSDLNTYSFKSQMVLPLKIGDKTVGVLNIQSKDQKEFDDNDLRFFQLLTDQITIEIENARLYEKTSRLVEEISDVDRIKSQFLANMSHEFRTPLNSIIGFSKVILTGIDGPINETQKQDLSAIHNAGQYLLRLVNDILDITKIEAGNMKLNMVKTNISNLISSLLPNAENLVKDKVIKIEFNPADDLPEIFIDKNRISQVLINLLTNAVKFTEYGKITISTSLEKLPNKQKVVMVKIKDSGIGINKKDQEKLFKPFSQAQSQENSRTFGSGLGLAISKSIIELHKGQIGLLESIPGGGSTFYFILPIE